MERREAAEVPIEEEVEEAIDDQDRIMIFRPKVFDVLLGRGRGNVRHPGNQRLQFAINVHANRYNDPNTSRADKTRIPIDIVNFVKQSGTSPGRFLKYDPEARCWFEIDDNAARLKVTNALRRHRPT